MMILITEVFTVAYHTRHRAAYRFDANHSVTVALHCHSSVNDNKIICNLIFIFIFIHHTGNEKGKINNITYKYNLTKKGK